MKRIGRPPLPRKLQRECKVTAMVTADEEREIDRLRHTGETPLSRSLWLRGLIHAAIAESKRPKAA